jgi:biopolymer transport protein ExbD
MRRRKRLNFEEPVVNLTPLIDVVFVILFTFIVVAPLLEVDKIQLAKSASAKEQHHSPEKHSPVVIHVFENDELTFNQQDVVLEDLPLLLLKAKAQYPEAKPQLFHDKKATFGTFQEIKNAAELAGFLELDVILKP